LRRKFFLKKLIADIALSWRHFARGVAKDVTCDPSHPDIDNDGGGIMIINIDHGLFTGASRIFVEADGRQGFLFIHREPTQVPAYQFCFSGAPDRFIRAIENSQAGVGYAVGDRYILERLKDADNATALMYGSPHTQFLACFKPSGLAQLLSGLRSIK